MRCGHAERTSITVAWTENDTNLDWSWEVRCDLCDEAHGLGAGRLAGDASFVRAFRAAEDAVIRWDLATARAMTLW